MAPSRLKFVLTGAPMVGKSSYFLRVTGRHLVGPLHVQPNTVGMAYANVYVTKEDLVVGDLSVGSFSKDEVKYSVALWDTAGQEHYRSLLPMYFRNANLVFVVHEGTERSKEAVREMISLVKECTPEASIYMIQNKSDACEFDTDFLDEVRDDLLGWAHVSALSNHNIHNSFADACDLLSKRAPPDAAEEEAPPTDTVRVVVPTVVDRVSGWITKC